MKQDLLSLDVNSRQAALQVHRSFLMQAPAGSGKTEVLTQRFLALLNVVEQPEQILALTFTKKAAAEMRYRVLHALHLAAKEAPTSEPALSRWRLAKQVLARDSQQQWNLLSSPHRLRLYTIDSLCATLVKQSPLAVPFSGHAILPDARPLYGQAVDRILNATHGDWLPALERLLSYFNTDYLYFQDLLKNLLGSRQRWLSDAKTISDGVQEARFSSDAVMALFQTQLESIQEYCSQKLARCFAFMDNWSEFWQLGCGAAAQLGNDLPMGLQPQELTLEHWQQFGQIVLTKDGSLRKTLTKRNGFPATEKVQKQQMQAHLTTISECANWSEMKVVWSLLIHTPKTYTGDAQHHLAIDVFVIAVAAANELDQLFHQQKVVDYVGLAQSALDSFGDADIEPSELLLRFDYQIHHILMDEFQDTSASQMQLFEKMTGGWQAGDGRSLFFVGDPMQSIYGFRDADVNLFYHIKNHGLGHLALEFLQLRRNFRTQPGLVSHLQQVLAPLFPVEEDSLLHQVTFSQAVAAQEQNSVDEPMVARLFEDRDAEAQWLVESVAEVLGRTQGAVAIVVRKKNHVPRITKLLRQQGIGYTAIELDPLWAFTSVRDLFHLAAVLEDTPQSYHFLAVCRSPWFGLSLQELEVVSGLWGIKPGVACYKNLSAMQGLSAQTIERLRYFHRALCYFQQASAFTLVERLRGLWISMLGPELTPKDELQPVSDFWTLLSSHVILDLELLQQQLEDGATSVVDPLARVEIMTIHKSKGLEFETVFVPSIQDFGGRGSSGMIDILNFQVTKDLASHTLFGVRGSTDKRFKEAQSGPSVAGFLKLIQSYRDYNELSRLLYVAVTRAEQQLYVSAAVATNSKGEQKMNPDSLLGRLSEYFEAEAVSDSINDELHQSYSDSQCPTMTSIQSGFVGRAFAPREAQLHVPASQKGDYWPLQVKEELTRVAAQRKGELLHYWLSKLDLEMLQADQDSQSSQPDWRCWLKNMVVSFNWPIEDLDVFVEQCVALIGVMTQDSLLPWLLKPRQFYCREQSWQRVGARGVETLRPDLVFFDEESDRLWVVDFKVTQTHPSLNAVQKAFGEQLQKYGQVFHQQGEYRHIELAIYQPQDTGAYWWHWPML